MTLTPETHEATVAAARAAAAKQAQGLVALEVAERLPFADVFLIASADNERQVRAIAGGVEEVLLELGYKTKRREGFDHARWILMDYGDLVVHIQHEEDREFYALESLWKDCPEVDLGDLESAAAASAAGDVTSQPEL